MGYYAEYFLILFHGWAYKITRPHSSLRYPPSVPCTFIHRSKPYWYLEIYFFGQSTSIRSRTVFVTLISVAISRYYVIQNSFIRSFHRWRPIILLLFPSLALIGIQLFEFSTSTVRSYQVLDLFRSQLIISGLNYLDLY